MVDVVGAFGSGEWIQAFVGRQSFADDPVGNGFPDLLASARIVDMKMLQPAMVYAVVD
ncbi:uncharacterized protein sS8_5039 [Methylocaldum marinum]|uniref:Uncharacterized protein n=1 Tax=Methylocaldum marinum TaxID=1432792 RepID=A0A250KZE0_9GAMM|nr:uncharacterized protein sS8_5039 [Methylocaldum marinum]